MSFAGNRDSLDREWQSVPSRKVGTDVWHETEQEFMHRGAGLKKVRKNHRLQESVILSDEPAGAAGR